MANLLRHSQLVFTRAACITRASSTTATSSGDAKVKPSGASDNLSQASRSGDATGMANRDAEQRKTTPDSAKTKSTSSGSAQTPQGSSATPSWRNAAYAVGVILTTVLVYNTFIKNQSPSKSSSLADAQSKGMGRDVHSASRDGSGGNKH